jgi:lipid II:glycine glycyltransferase (peptidoglycan interpeptide bridge formation enzyme)
MGRLSEISPSEFKAFAEQHPQANWNQTLEAETFRQSRAEQTIRLGIKSQTSASSANSLTAACLLQVRERCALAIGGPLLDYRDRDLVESFFSQLAEFAHRQKFLSIACYPNLTIRQWSARGKLLENFESEIFLPSALPTPATVTGTRTQVANWKILPDPQGSDPRVPKFHFVKDFSQIHSSDQLLASFRQTTRQSVKQTLNPHYQVSSLKLDQLAVLQNLLNSSNTKNRVPGRDLNYLQQLHSAYAEKAEFLVVLYDDTPISGGIFVNYPFESVYFLSGTATEFRHLLGAHHLQYYVMTRCIDQKVPRYNLMGIPGQFTHNPLLTFKSGFRGVIDEQIGQLRYIVDQKGYLFAKIINKLK